MFLDNNDSDILEKRKEVYQNVNKTNIVMASDEDDFSKKFEEIKATVRAQFAGIYASLKARELKTLRQLDALRKQCQDDNDLARNCVRDIRVSFDNDTTILDNIYNYGAINLEKLNFISQTFSLEDYVKPEDDHMYSYKTIEEATKGKSKEELEIEVAALKQMTATNDCVCYVEINSDEVSHKFSDERSHKFSELVPTAPEPSEEDVADRKYVEITEEEKSFSSESDSEVKKLEPTDDWMNSIKNQIETEPSQVTDDMEHSTITCSKIIATF